MTDEEVEALLVEVDVEAERCRSDPSRYGSLGVLLDRARKAGVDTGTLRGRSGLDAEEVERLIAEA